MSEWSSLTGKRTSFEARYIAMTTKAELEKC